MKILLILLLQIAGTMTFNMPFTEKAEAVDEAKCKDHVISQHCPLIPEICNNSLAWRVCPKTCGYCGKTELLTSPLPWSSATTGPCPDHNDVCCEKSDICQNSLGHIVCPNTCPLLSTASTAATTLQTTTPCPDNNTVCCETKDICQMKYANILCPKTCSGTPAGLMPHLGCQDEIMDDLCTKIADVCHNHLAALICPQTCGYCGPALGVTSSVHQTPQTDCKDDPGFPCNSSICSDPDFAWLLCPETCGNCTGKTACIDHNHVCCWKADICQNPLGHIVCPNTCPVPAAGVCQDDPDFVCSPGWCNVTHIARWLCPKYCGLCPAVTLTPKVTTTESTTTTTVTTRVSTTESTTITTVPTTASATASTTTTAVPTTVSTTPATTHPRIRHSCHQCGNMATQKACTIMEIAIGSAKPCQSGSYCMTDVHNSHTGLTDVYKRCVGLKECETKWFSETSDLAACVKYDQINKVPDLTCHFCCTGDNCNSRYVPPDSSLYSP